jgi:hypothetical protein
VEPPLDFLTNLRTPLNRVTPSFSIELPLCFLSIDAQSFSNSFERGTWDCGRGYSIFIFIAFSDQIVLSLMRIPLNKPPPPPPLCA